MPGTDSGLPRSIQVTLAAAALIALSPVLCLAAASVALTSPGPVLFRHRRAGRNGEPFVMLKFRTMRVDRAGAEITASGDCRVTRAGRILRMSKVDELPELWNVIRGDMALVGPRPEALRYVDTTSALWREVLHVPPGITDPVTLRLRNEEELLAAVGPEHEAFYRSQLLPYKLQRNREYLRHRTWRTDVAVLVRTVWAVVAPSRAPRLRLQDIVSSAITQPGAHTALPE